MTFDLGAQAERTALAWRRTSLALLAVSTILLRRADRNGWSVVLLPAVFALFLSLACTIRLHERYKKKRQGIACDRYAPEIGMILLMTSGTLTLVSTAAYIVIVAK